MSAVIQARPSNSVIVRIADRFGVDADKMLHTLKSTAFKGEVTNEQMMALCVVADQYSLNPFTREIFAFPAKDGGIVPVVGVDGWSRIINTNTQFDGMDFVDGPVGVNQIPEWIECRMHRKDRAHPIAVKEYFAEVCRDTGPWKSHPRRMLRHKAMIQCARVAFGFVGIFDEDEAERIIDVTPGSGYPGYVLTPEKRSVLLPKFVSAIEARDAAKLKELVDSTPESLQRGVFTFLSSKQKAAMREVLQKATPVVATPQEYVERFREALNAGGDERIKELHQECNVDATFGLEVSTLLTPTELERINEALDRLR